MPLYRIHQTVCCHPYLTYFLPIRQYVAGVAVAATATVPAAISISEVSLTTALTVDDVSCAVAYAVVDDCAAATDVRVSCVVSAIGD